MLHTAHHVRGTAEAKRLGGFAPMGLRFNLKSRAWQFFLARGASESAFLSASVSVRLALACMIWGLAESTHGQPLLLKTETFDADPGWDGTNNRATDPGPRQIVQNFGFNSST